MSKSHTHKKKKIKINWTLHQKLQAFFMNNSWSYFIVLVFNNPQFHCSQKHHWIFHIFFFLKLPQNIHFLVFLILWIFLKTIAFFKKILFEMHTHQKWRTIEGSAVKTCLIVLVLHKVAILSQNLIFIFFQTTTEAMTVKLSRLCLFNDLACY